MPIKDKYNRTVVRPMFYTPQFLVCPGCKKPLGKDFKLREILKCTHCNQLLITTDLNCFNHYNKNKHCGCKHPFVGSSKYTVCQIKLPLKQLFTVNSKYISVFTLKHYNNQQVYHGTYPHCLSSIFERGLLTSCELNGVKTHGFGPEQCTKYAGLDIAPAKEHSHGVIVTSNFSGYLLDASNLVILGGELNNLLLNEFKSSTSGIQYIEHGQSIVFHSGASLPVAIEYNMLQAQHYFDLLDKKHQRLLVPNSMFFKLSRKLRAITGRFKEVMGL
jgi:hypothetical protein